MIIIFSGYNQRAVIAFIRTLEKNKINRYVIIAASSQDTILQTAYAARVWHIREHKELNLQEICRVIDMVCQKYGEDTCMIAPSTEALNRFLLQHRSTLQEHKCIVPLVDEELYITVSDKDRFCSLCAANNLRVPAQTELKEEFESSFVAKPKQYLSQDGHAYSPVIVQTKMDFDYFGRNYNKDDFFYQEYVEGESFYLLYYFMKTGEVLKFSQVNYAQQPDGKSILIAACASLHNSRISDEYEKLFRDAGYFGFVMVELRKNNDDYYMIEANPRFWGPSQLFCDAGCNFFEMFLYEYGYLEKVPEFKIDYDAKYVWSGGADRFPPSACVWYGRGKNIVTLKQEEFLKNDIYKREDTRSLYFKGEIMQEKKKKLEELYMTGSKHSNYQILPAILRGMIDTEELVIQSRYEQERFNYIMDNVDIKGKRVLDIGGNSGFFTFETYSNGAETVDYYEGNHVHAEFVKEAVNMLDLQQHIRVHPAYYLFDSSEKKYDIAYCLNVVHHLGDDFGTDKEIEKAKESMAGCMNQMAKVTDIMVFQMGYNWCGDSRKGLFENGTKQEMEKFLQEETKDYWEIIKTGIAVGSRNHIQYVEKNNRNNQRDDTLGEFLNRPIFIMKSKQGKESMKKI